MSFNTLLKRATNLFGFGHRDIPQPPSKDAEIVFCKNNVCVHPPSILRQESDPNHRPGYITIRCHQQEGISHTLILTWIPNTTLHKNPWSIENIHPANNGSSIGCASPRLALGPSFHAHVTMCSPFSRRTSLGSEVSMDEGYKLAVKEIERQDSLSVSSTVSDCCSLEKDPSSSYIDSSSQVDSGIGVKGESQDLDRTSLNTSAHVDMSSHRQNSSSKYDSFYKIGAINLSGENVWSREDQGGSSVPNEPDIVQVPEEKIPPDEKGKNSCDKSEVIATKASSRKHEKDLDEDALDEINSSLQDLETDGTVDSDGDSENEDSVTENQKRCHYHICSDSCTSDFSTVTMEGNNKERAESHSDSTSLTSNQYSESCPPSPQGETYAKRLSHNWLEETPESLALHHNLSFQEGLSSVASSTTTSRAASPIRRSHTRGVFRVDLGKMRSLRLFFSNRECTCGQLVIASMESQYKIFHFHYGGLDHLARVFEDWNCLMKAEGESEEASDVEHHKPYRQFMVCRPQVTEEELHPEEGSMEAVDAHVLTEIMNEEGQIEEDLFFRKAIFFAGVDPSVRKDVWPFLFRYFPYKSTYEEREQIREATLLEYEKMRRRREMMSPSDYEMFWPNVECIIEKDVVRTDRNNPFFAGEGNPNIEKMKNILLNYAVSMGSPYTGYTQGMSDLLAPVLTEIQNESDAYGCFVGLMQKTIFVSSPTDLDMDRNLTYLRGLISLVAPRFYEHLEKHVDGLELLFCHRWILLCFKREFEESEALSMWEACWANYQTDYFHLFLCLAIICVYGGDIICQNLRTDEILLHFSSLSMHMDGELILRKARGLLHQFRKMPRISCKLSGLCELCGPGMWDSGHAPVVECSGHPDGEECSYRGDATSLSGIL